MKETNLPLNKEILKISIPAIVSFMFIVFYELIDAFWLDKLDYSSVFASLGAASFITWSLYSVMHIVNAGVNSLVAFYKGAGKSKAYNRVSWEGYILAGITGLTITLIMTACYPIIFRKIGLTGIIYKDACSYFSVMNSGFTLMFLYSLSGIIFNAHGDTKTNMKIQISTLVLNAIIDPFFILGLGSLPSFGIKGAAIASILSQSIGLFIALYVLYRKNYINITPPKKLFKFMFALKIFKIGFPIATVNWVFAMVYPLLTAIISKLGNMEALGALNLCHKIEGFAYFSAMGFSIAATTLSGQYMGKKDPNMAYNAVNQTVKFITGVLAIECIFFIFCPEFLLKFVTDKPLIIAEGAKYLRIIGIFEIFLGWEIVYEGGFTGIGKTWYPMIVSIPGTLSRIPLGYFFAITLGYGVAGLWWAVSISTLLKGTIIGYLFISKRWMK